MIRSEHGYLRSSEEDDAPWFYQLYDMKAPRFSLLDQKREPLFPTLSEIRETLSSKEAARSQFFTVENAVGDVAGFAVLRGLNQESGTCELALLMLEEADVLNPLAAWTLEHLRDRAYNVMRLRKMSAQALSRETDLQTFLRAQGFQHDGVQREVLYAQGQWIDVVAFSDFHPALRTE